MPYIHHQALYICLELLSYSAGHFIFLATNYSHSRVVQGWQKPVFFFRKKNQPTWVFWGFIGFLGFLFFLGFLVFFRDFFDFFWIFDLKKKSLYFINIKSDKKFNF